MFDSFNRGQKLTILVFALSNFCAAVCVSLQAPFYPKEAEKKGATASDYGFVFGVYELFVFIASPIMGKNMGKFGAKRVFNAGLFTIGTCCIMFGLLDTIPDKTSFIAMSFVVRSIEAIGNACFLTASFSIIAQEFPDRVSTMFACLETCFGIGLIAGPSVGGALFQWGGYIVPFVTLGSMLISAAVFTFFVLPSSYNEPPPVSDRQDNKGLLAVLRVPPIALAAYSVVCASVSLGFLQATLEPHLRQFNLTPVLLGGMFVIQGGTYAFTAPMWGYLCDKVIDPRLATLIGSGLITLTFLFLGPVPFFPFPAMIEVCIATLILHGLGFSAVLVSAFGMAHREAIANGFPDNLGTYALISALWTMTFALGACVGPSIAGVLVDNFNFGWASLFVVVTELTVFVITFSFVGYRWWRKRSMIKGYERLTPQRESGVLKSNTGGGYGAIPTTKQIMPRTQRAHSPFASPSTHGRVVMSNADTIVVDETRDGHLAVAATGYIKPSSSTATSKPSKNGGKKKGRRPPVPVVIADKSEDE